MAEAMSEQEQTKELRAVRWPLRKVASEQQWSAWHLTEDGQRTQCGLTLPSYAEADLPYRVTCKQCLKALKQ